MQGSLRLSGGGICTTLRIFLLLCTNIMTKLHKEKLCRFLLLSPAVPSINHFQAEGKAGPPLWRALQKNVWGWSQQVQLWSTPSLALLLLLNMNDAGYSFSAVWGPVSQLRWVLRIPAGKKGCRTAGSIEALLLQEASLGNRFPRYIGLCFLDFPYYIIQNSLT